MWSSMANARRYFATSQFMETRVVGSDLEQVPTSVVHAKEMGTILTVCGLFGELAQALGATLP